jgi:hypothetical protein
MPNVNKHSPVQVLVQTDKFQKHVSLFKWERAIAYESIKVLEIDFFYNRKNMLL